MEQNPYSANSQPDTLENDRHWTHSNKDVDDRLPILVPSFWGMTITQFLGAFNDNVYKQIVLLLAIPLALNGAAGGEEQGGDVQGWATAIFSLPFVIFSGFAGYLSDKYSKQRVVFLAKVAEIAIMALSAVAFLYYSSLGMTGTWIVLFLMATQSAFFGPGKYGILPELFSKRRLPAVNGVMLMTTFLAIILGTLVAGLIFDAFAEPDENNFAKAGPFWKGSAICVLIAVVGTATSLLVRRTKPAEPEAKLSNDALWLPRDIRNVLFQDKPLFIALLVSCVFWLVSGICVPVVNRVGLLLEVNKFETSILVAAIAFGIMIGSFLAIGFQSLKIVSARSQITLGLWGMFGCLAVLALWQGALPLFSYWMIFSILLLMGIFVAVYAIPLQVFLQDRPPDQLKGRMIATMNQANFIGILISGPLYQVFQSIALAAKMPVNSVFGMMALLLLPIALFYRLDDSPLPSTVQE